MHFSCIPSLDELLKKVIAHPQDMKMLCNYFSEVASGREPPILRRNNAVFAAQIAVIVIKHALTTHERN